VSANEKQVAGAHYGGTEVAYQHWDIVVEHGLNYFEGQITKYVMRARKKNGKQDLQKALHFIEKYLEVYDKMCLPAAPGPEPITTGTQVAGFSRRIQNEASVPKPIPLDFRGHYTIEGYSLTNALRTCLHCRKQWWSDEDEALRHLRHDHPEKL
jgi:hypothetical protein